MKMILCIRHFRLHKVGNYDLIWQECKITTYMMYSLVWQTDVATPPIVIHGLRTVWPPVTWVLASSAVSCVYKTFYTARYTCSLVNDTLNTFLLMVILRSVEKAHGIIDMDTFQIAHHVGILVLLRFTYRNKFTQYLLHR